MRANKIMVRIGIILLFSILIWKFILYLNNMFLGDEYNRVNHLLIALITTILCLILINFARRIDKISWKQFGMNGLNNNIISFFVGVLIWMVPAIIGLVICLLTGWSEITVKTDLNQLLLSVLLLLVTVFLIEAFPEELIFRGYIYGYLKELFPNWITIVIQSVIFSLFAYFIGALYSMEQLLFIPGYGFMLGYFRAKSGNVWTPIGFHVAIMTATQILSPIHRHFDVDGIFAIQFFAFNLLPYVLGAIVLDYFYPKNDLVK